MEILCFTFGEARDPLTWSNVPYYLTKELENQGCRVYCVDVYSGKFLKRVCQLFNKMMRILFGNDTMILIELLPMMKLYYSFIVKKSLKKYPRIEKMLFFSYSMQGVNCDNVESIFFNDFTIDYVLENIHNRKPTKYEMRLIANQDRVMQSANKIVSLFPSASEFYAKKYGRDKVKNVPGHILNCDWNIEDCEKYLDKKKNSNTVLFIGRKAYLKGLNTLIEALHLYNHSHDPITLIVIGMTDKDIGINEDKYVKTYGVLNKSVNRERKIFYESIESARVVINTSENWAGMSSMVEALFLYTPIITSKYEEFQAIFGEKLSFGYYCEAGNVGALVESISSLFALNDEKYRTMCKKAHESVNDFTWKNWTRIILE